MSIDFKNYDSELFLHFLLSIQLRECERYCEGAHIFRKGHCWIGLCPLSYASITAVNLDWMYVPAHLQRAGHGRRMLDAITEAADAVDIDLTATARPFYLKRDIESFIRLGMPESDMVLLDSEDYTAWEEVLIRYGFSPDPMLPVSEESMLLGRRGLIRYPNCKSKEFEK